MRNELLPLHRLDCGTEGIVVMAKNAAFAKRFGKLMRMSSSAEAEKVPFEKTYLALSSAPAPVGILRHHALINVRVKGLPASTRLIRTPCHESVECVLEVLEV
jgi:23S rRNA-/tRNA-specific pseudouridylate synthase